MFTAVKHTYLVVRRHVDYGRLNSMLCWPC